MVALGLLWGVLVRARAKYPWTAITQIIGVIDTSADAAFQGPGLRCGVQSLVYKS